MKIKLDENLPSGVTPFLQSRGHDVHSLHDEHLVGHADKEIWQAAQKESRFLITQDLDFSDRRLFVPGSHFGILLLRLRFPNRQSLIHRIESIFQKEDVEDWAGCFVVATDRKIRVLKPNKRRHS